MKKIGNNCKKTLKFVILKSCKTSRNYTVTYFQTLEEVPWLLRLKKHLKKAKKKVFENFSKFLKKMLKFVTLKSCNDITWPIKIFQ